MFGYLLGRDNAACDEASNAACRMTDEMERLRADNARLVQQLEQQQQQTMSTHSPGGDSVQLDFIHAQQELSRCKEALLGSTVTYLLLMKPRPHGGKGS